MTGSAHLNVVCVLKSGGDYDADYVGRLRDGVTRNLPAEHRFMCLSDMPVPAERIPLKHDWPGWWAKMEVFRIPGPVLYLDLDTIIAGDLSDIAIASRDGFTMLRDFHREKGLGSGLMAWGSSARTLYDIFALDPKGWREKIGGQGDQGFIEKNVNPATVARWQDKLPGQVVSYKAHVRKAENIRENGDGAIPAAARVICFHGRPRPHEIGWLAA